MNKTIKAIIIEDEAPASRLLHAMLTRLRPNWDIKILTDSVEEAIEWFSINEHPHIIFLDIQLADGNAFDFLTQAKPTSSIIFTTAYDQYAIRAFSVNSIDYILKPVDEGRLLDAITKFESTPIISPNYIDTILEALKPQAKRFRTRFLISQGDKFVTLMVEDIAFIYSENKMTYAVNFKGATFQVELPLNILIEQLDPDIFFRANRQIIINIKSVVKIEPYFAGKISVTTHPKSPMQIIVSREKAVMFKTWLNY